MAGIKFHVALVGWLMSIAYLDPGNLEADLQSGAVAGYSLVLQAIDPYLYLRFRILVTKAFNFLYFPLALALILCTYCRFPHTTSGSTHGCGDRKAPRAT